MLNTSLLLAFGEYTCRIVGNVELIQLIPTHWSKFQQYSDSPVLITIRLEEGLDNYDGGISDGWDLRDRQGIPVAMYIRNAKALFSLRHTVSHEITVCIRKALDSYVRIGIHYGLMLALCQECIGLHGVTLLCRNEIIILSAPSGTGKTTLAKLLETYCNAIVINGDFALLHPTDDGVIFEPTPFCGTSRRSLNHRLRVNRVVFLGQAKDCHWQEQGSREALKNILCNAFVPTWDKKLQDAVQKNAMRCLPMLQVNCFSFPPTQKAAVTFLQHIADQ